ncbi:caspase family protein [Providencia rettgeri]|uniref:caspase family protein n=1 Tax=Providencia rettgeri TaxID=587 RepID=UPI0020519FC1|nr:caspase family protein [Providencia rettgeri]UPQ40655.1 caspase family protein [Providencia rettgeri]
MQRRLSALIVGIAAYSNGAPLKNSVNDAEDIARALENLGFNIIKLTDVTSEDIDRGLEEFKDKLNNSDVGLFYFAGHGMQIKGENYLNTTNTCFVDEVSAKYSSFPLNQIIDMMDSCQNTTNIIILDACRNNPYVRAWNRGPEQHNLAAIHAPKGTFIAFATSPGQSAKDGLNRNGSFTESLLSHINTQDITIEDLFKRVRNTLSAKTSGSQTSWEHTSLSGDFFFNISIGRVVEQYSSDALADSLYMLKSGDIIDEIIKDLKITNWYTQNAAIVKLNISNISAADNNSLFVLGRNIYQASCGSANSATEFLNEFETKTLNIENEKTKCIFDGILFEIFFNSKGEIRKDFKTSKFNLVFIQKFYSKFSGSFDFIAEILMKYQHRFYLIPGKNRKLNVDIVSDKNDEDENLIKEIHFQGVNILRTNDGNERLDLSAYPISYNYLVKFLSEQMVIPLEQLEITCSFKQEDRILLPYGITVKK